MKKLLILTSLLGLAACDGSPNISAELICAGKKQVVMDVYDDYLTMSVDGGEIMRLDRTGETIGAQSVGLSYNGLGWTMNISILRDKPMLKHVIMGTPDDDLVYACDVLVPYKSKYKPATDVEKCIEYIVDTVYFKSPNAADGLIIHNPQDIIFPDGHIEHDINDVDIPAADAIALSPNWDYSNMGKYYSLYDGVQEHEQDACEVKERLQKYIKQKGIYPVINPDGTPYKGS